MAIDVSAVVAQFGAYYIDQGQNLDNVKKLLYALSETAALFSDRPQTGDYFRSTNAHMSSVLQPFQKAFTSKGNISFKPNAFPLFHMKIDQGVWPDDIASSYLGFLSAMDDNDRANWPIIRYIIEEHILAAKAADVEANALTAKFVVPTANVASPASESFDGILEVLKKYNTAGRLNMGDGPETMGTIATDPKDFCTQIEDFVASMNPELRKRLDYIVMSETLATRYKRGKAAKYGGNNGAYLVGTTVQDAYKIEDYAWISVKGFISHEGKNIIWATPAVNRIRPIWKSTLQNVFKVESYRREVSIFTDWYEAIEFEVPELVVCNEHLS